jgi:HEAT repeat protein
MTRIALWLARHQLKSKAPARRMRALKKLRAAIDNAVISLDGKITIALLDHVLTDPETDIRREAAATLGDLRDNRAVPPLLRALNDRDDNVQDAAIQSLKRLDDRSAAAALVPKLAHGSPNVRWRAAQTLKSLSWQPRTVAEQIAFHVATGELERLAAFGAAAIPALTDVFNAGTPEQKVAVAGVLGEIADPGGFKILQGAVRDHDPRLRTAAIYALARTGAQAAAPALIPALRDSERNVRLAAASALGTAGDPQAVEPLIKLLNDKDWEVRSAALESLGRLGDSRAFPSVAKHLDDADPEVREVAVETLGRVGDESIIEKLVLTMVDAHSGVRMAATRALAKIDPHWEGSERVRRLLPDIQSALKSRDAGVQAAAAALLRRMTLSSPGGTVASAAAGPAANEPPRQHQLLTQALRELLRDPHPALRLAAAETVGALKLSAGADALKTALNDADPRVSHAAQASLALLSSSNPAAPAPTGHAGVEDVLIYSALGELLHHRNCRDLAGWLKLSEAITRQGRLLAGAGPLGEFKRLEIVSPDSQIHALATADFGAIIRFRPPAVPGTASPAKPDRPAVLNPTITEETKTRVTDWLRRAPSVRGVLVRGLRFPDQTIVCDLDSRDLPPAVLEQIYHAVSDTFAELAGHQVPATRLLWTCDRSGLHCARRSDRTLLGAFVPAKAGDIDLPALDRQFKEFTELA